MKNTSFRNVTALILASALLSACGAEEPAGKSEEFLRIAAKYKMKEKDHAIFQVCIDKSAGKSPYVKMGKDIMLMSSIPDEVCGCQTSTIAYVLKEKKVDAYGKFMKWVLTPERLGAPSFTKADFTYTAKPREIADKLALALESCTRQYIAANEKAGKKLLTLYVDKEKKKKEDEAKAAAAKKKSET